MQDCPKFSFWIPRALAKFCFLRIVLIKPRKNIPVLGPLHMSPVGGTNFVFCSYGKFNPGYRDEKCPKGHQNTRGTAFRPVSDLTSHAQLKMFRPGIRAGVFIWEEFEKFPARLPRSRSQKPRSGLPDQPAFSYEHIEIFVKKRAARRDLGNRACPVNRAHMKRPLVATTQRKPRYLEMRRGK